MMVLISVVYSIIILVGFLIIYKTFKNIILFSNYMIDNNSNYIKAGHYWTSCNKIADLYPVKKVHGLCFNEEGKLLIIERNIKSGWTIPGGTHRLFETTVDTLIRETFEEASVELFDSHIIGYRSTGDVFSNNIKDSGYNILYFALISDINKSKKDPSSNKIRSRKFIEPRKFDSYLSKKICDFGMIESALNHYNSITHHIKQYTP